MTKLEVLYRMAGAMKSKEKVNGTVNLVALDGDKTVANVTNNFVKDKVNGTMSVDIDANIELGELNIDKQVKKTVTLEEMHKKHHGMHKKHHGKCGEGKKFNKFAKLEMMFKTLNDMNLSEEGDSKVLELDMKGILEKKKEKMKKYHAEGNKCEHKPEDMDIDAEMMEMLKIKHAIFKELMTSEYEAVTGRIVLNKDYEVESVAINATGSKSANIKISLNY